MFAISLPSQPFLCDHFVFHIFFQLGCFGKYTLSNVETRVSNVFVMWFLLSFLYIFSYTIPGCSHTFTKLRDIIIKFHFIAWHFSIDHLISKQLIPSIQGDSFVRIYSCTIVLYGKRMWGKYSSQSFPLFLTVLANILVNVWLNLFTSHQFRGDML